jgi:DNA-binding NarL/FixJ family response regulator
MLDMSASAQTATSLRLNCARSHDCGRWAQRGSSSARGPRGAKQENIRLSERVHAGLSRARAQGKTLGRPKAAVRPERVLAMRAKGLSLRAIAAETGVSVMTVQRIVEAA